MKLLGLENEIFVCFQKYCRLDILGGEKTSHGRHIDAGYIFAMF
jgi:hypothetical protein